MKLVLTPSNIVLDACGILEEGIKYTQASMYFSDFEVSCSDTKVTTPREIIKKALSENKGYFNVCQLGRSGLKVVTKHGPVGASAETFAEFVVTLYAYAMKNSLDIAISLSKDKLIRELIMNDEKVSYAISEKAIDIFFYELTEKLRNHPAYSIIKTRMVLGSKLAHCSNLEMDWGKNRDNKYTGLALAFRNS